MFRLKGRFYFIYLGFFFLFFDCFIFFCFFFVLCFFFFFFFFSSRRRHTRYIGDWSSDVCSSDLACAVAVVSLLFLFVFGIGPESDPHHISAILALYAAGAFWFAWRERLVAFTDRKSVV